MTRTSSQPHLSWLPFLESVRDPALASITHTGKVGHLYLQMDCPSDSLSFSNFSERQKNWEELTGISLLGLPCRQCAPHSPAGTHTTKIPGEMSLSPHLFWCVPWQHEVPSGIAMVLPSAKAICVLIPGFNTAYPP